jgi:hypothetical protein
MKPQAVRKITRRSRRVEGWFTSDAAGLFGLIDELQKEADVCGDLFEIGAHHGKSAVLLGAMARSGDTVGVCDVFGRQDANVSSSGAGDRAIFEGNMRQIAPAAELAVYEKLSSVLTAEEIGGAGRYRFFHIDGGHFVEEALADLRLAAEVLHEHGVIVLDDPFHPDWPGVTEAAVRFLQEHDEYAAIALGFNKLVFTRSPQLYEQMASERSWEYVPGSVYSTKRAVICGHEALIYWIPGNHQTPRLNRFLLHARSNVERVRTRLARASQREH